MNASMSGRLAAIASVVAPRAVLRRRPASAIASPVSVWARLSILLLWGERQDDKVQNTEFRTQKRQSGALLVPQVFAEFGILYSELRHLCRLRVANAPTA